MNMSKKQFEIRVSTTFHQLDSTMQRQITTVTDSIDNLSLGVRYCRPVVDDGVKKVNVWQVMILCMIVRKCHHTMSCFGVIAQSLVPHKPILNFKSLTTAYFDRLKKVWILSLTLYFE